MKRDAERISEKIAHVRDIKDLERYEQDLKRLKIYKRGRRSEWSSLAVSIDSKSLSWILSHRGREIGGREFDAASAKRVVSISVILRMK